MKSGYQAIVIGAGHNGLVAAAMLARKGVRPLVLEARGHAGGMLGDPGFRISPIPFAMHPPVLRALGIDAQTEPMDTLVATSERTIRVSGDRAEGAADGEARAFTALVKRLEGQAAALSGLLTLPPPDLGNLGIRDLARHAGTAWKLRRLGKTDLRELLRIGLSNVHDLIEDEIGDGPLGASLAMDATLGGAMGPRSPGTVLTLLYRLASSGNRRVMPRQGIDELIATLADAVTLAGGSIRTGEAVERILVSGDHVTGVRLRSGEVIDAPAVLSGAAPRTTLVDLLGADHLDAEFVRRCRIMASGGMVARLDFNLTDAFRLARGIVPGRKDRIVIADSAAAIEAAFNAAKHGHLPGRPVMEAWHDADAGRLSVTVQFVPAVPPGGWTKARREELQSSVTNAIARVMPDFADIVTATRLMTPADIETEYGVPGGHWHHGEFRIDQALMLRPFDGAAHYQMPVSGLYLCGAGTHPGGDMSGAPGLNAATAALAAMKGRRAG